MSLEIREVKIIATVNNKQTGSPAGAATGVEISESLINAVAAQVMDIIRDKMER